MVVLCVHVGSTCASLAYTNAKLILTRSDPMYKVVRAQLSVIFWNSSILVYAGTVAELTAFIAL